MCSPSLHHAERSEILRRARLEVVTHAGHHVPPRRDAAAVEHFQIGTVGAAIDALALAAQPEAVEIGADPALPLPSHCRPVPGSAFHASSRSTSR